MSGRDRDEELAARARAQLDRDLEGLDESTRARLRAARLRALDGLEDRGARRGFAAPRGLLAASAGAVALALVVASWRQRDGAEHALADELDDADILASTDDWELYDDLDFYRWLDEDGTL